ITSVSARRSELVALVKLSGAVTAKTDQALLRITPAGPISLLRTGDLVEGNKVLSITAFQPGEASPGQGRTDGDERVVVRVKTDLAGDELVLIDDAGTCHVLLSTAGEDPMLHTRTSKIFLPATAGAGTAARISAKFAPGTKA